MHTEYICVQRRTIEKLLAHDCQAIAVGTTSVRTLESLYYMGLKVLRNPDVSEEELHVSQWEPYTLAQASLAKDSRSSSARLQSEAAQVTAKRFASEELSSLLLSPTVLSQQAHAHAWQRYANAPLHVHVSGCAAGHCISRVWQVGCPMLLCGEHIPRSSYPHRASTAVTHRQ